MWIDMNSYFLVFALQVSKKRNIYDHFEFREQKQWFFFLLLLCFSFGYCTAIQSIVPSSNHYTLISIYNGKNCFKTPTTTKSLFKSDFSQNEANGQHEMKPKLWFAIIVSQNIFSSFFLPLFFHTLEVFMQNVFFFSSGEHSTLKCWRMSRILYCIWTL